MADSAAPPIPLLADGPLITAAEVAARFPGARGAARLHPATVTRWILKGVRGPGGRRVRLEAVRVGSRWMTTQAALARFAAALAAPADAAPSRSPAARNRASERAATELERMGA